VKKYRFIVFTLLLGGLLSSACSKTSLVCQLSVKSLKETQVCSSVLSLTSGVLRLDEKRKQFNLVAHYAACYQTTEIKVLGKFKQQQDQSVLDLELLAKKIEREGKAIEQFSRTIGLVTLDKESLEGRFVDIWAIIRTHTQTVENTPTIEVKCRRE
jgi:isoaspartyl peptidase/L-asparaginase-like protein (Ntn-hydrolase superfamily)